MRCSQELREGPRGALSGPSAVVAVSEVIDGIGSKLNGLLDELQPNLRQTKEKVGLAG